MMSEAFQVTLEAARLYERIAARYVLGPWAPSLVDAASVKQGDRVLDLACGTGVVARIAAQRTGVGGCVIGLDLNPGMIAVARLLPAEGAQVDWIEGSALDIPVPAASVDVVLCQQGLQFFPDKALALREMRRVLDRAGRLALSVWSGVGVYNGAIADALRRFADPDTVASFCASRKVPDKEALERLALEAGFSDVSVRVVRMNIRLPSIDRFVLEHLAATPVAATIAALDVDTRENIGASVMHALQRFRDGDGVTFPEETHVLSASV